MKPTKKVFQVLFLILFICHQTASYKLFRLIRSINDGTQKNKIESKQNCQEYSSDGNCLGDIYVEHFGDKCVLCPVKCKTGYKKDSENNCRKVLHQNTPQKSCYFGLWCF